MKRIMIIIVLILLLATWQIPPVNAQTNSSVGVVRAVMFWTEGCPHCKEVLDNVLPPLQEQYGEQLDIRLEEIVTSEDIFYLIEVGAEYGIPNDRVGTPLLIIDDQALLGPDQIATQLPGLIETYLNQGGVDWPAIPEKTTYLQSEGESADTSMVPAAPTTVQSASVHSSGFTLAIVTMIGMAAVLVYSLVSFAIGKTIALPSLVDWLIPVLIVIGIGVAAYLSYVETQSVEAVCGPVGDCNTVQQSSYAMLFGFLPVGVLGLIGYVGLLGAWLVRRFVPAQEKLAALAFWGMSIFAVVFSIYLTYLELFVIKAVCMWCITSAIIVTGLLLLGTPPVVRHYIFEDET